MGFARTGSNPVVVAFLLPPQLHPAHLLIRVGGII